MRIWFTSDTHFGHTNIIAYCDRPFPTVRLMTQELIRNWNMVVAEGDLVIHVGDFSFMSTASATEVMKLLNGRKVLVRGNHDPSPGKMLKVGFDMVCDQMTVQIAGETVLVCHYPYAPGKNEPAPKHDVRYLDRRPKNDGGWLIHGHRHSPSKGRVRNKMIDVGVDAWDYMPVSLQELEQIIRLKGGAQCHI